MNKPTNEQYCNCKSYNHRTGSVPEIIMVAPEWANKQNGICVDACIAGVVQHLWLNNIKTLGSCCGHNMNSPSLIVTNIDDVIITHRLIAEIDSRSFKVMVWVDNELVGYFPFDHVETPACWCNPDTEHQGNNIIYIHRDKSEAN